MLVMVEIREACRATISSQEALPTV